MVFNEGANCGETGEWEYRVGQGAIELGGTTGQQCSGVSWFHLGEAKEIVSTCQYIDELLHACARACVSAHARATQMAGAGWNGSPFGPKKEKGGIEG